MRHLGDTKGGINIHGRDEALLRAAARGAEMPRGGIELGIRYSESSHSGEWGQPSNRVETHYQLDTCLQK